MIFNEVSIQIKDTKFIKMFHLVNSGDVVIQLVDTQGTIANQLTIPHQNIYSVIRGLLTDRQRFQRVKTGKKELLHK